MGKRTRKRARTGADHEPAERPQGVSKEDWARRADRVELSRGSKMRLERKPPEAPPRAASSVFGRIRESWQVTGYRPGATGMAGPGNRPRRGRPERPEAPWGSFPAAELAIFLGVVVLGVGLVIGRDGGIVPIVIGVGLCLLGVMEFTIREHFAGYRSHVLLLAMLATLAVHVVVIFSDRDLSNSVWPFVADLAIFGAFSVVLRRQFARRREAAGTA